MDACTSIHLQWKSLRKPITSFCEVFLKRFLAFFSGYPQVRKQRDEHPAVQLLSASLLVTELHGRLHVVLALRWRKR